MCTSPNYAIYIKKKSGETPYLKFINLNPEDNYRNLKQKYGETLLSLPCGKCEQCKKDYATQWATRIALESQKYKDNWFITLTYNNAHYKDLNKEDIEEFFNNLAGGHKKRSFKYWLAGEYGPTTKRAHYHLILMNYDIKPIPLAKSPLGNQIYESEKITKAWGKGYVEIQEAGNNAAAYCAKYAAKSVSEGKFRPMMSKGLALEELITKQDFINKYGYIQGENGKKYKIPRYYFKKITTEAAAALKEKQNKKAKQKTAEKARYRHLEYSLLEEEANLEASKGRRAKV